MDGDLRLTEGPALERSKWKANKKGPSEGPMPVNRDAIEIDDQSLTLLYTSLQSLGKHSRVFQVSQSM